MAELSNIITGELNLDQSPKFLPKGDYSDARNIITGTSVSSDKIRLEKIIGTVALTESLGYTISKIIGSCIDEASGDVYFMAVTTVSTANKIIKKDSNNVLSTVLSYDFGWTSSLILNSVFFLQDSIIWVDNTDEIKRFPLNAYPVTPTAGSLDGQEISLMKKPPLTQPIIGGYFQYYITKSAGGKINERDADYQFASYYEYIDGGRSVLSPISKVLPRSTYQVYNDTSVREWEDFRIYMDMDDSDVVGGATMDNLLRRDSGYDSIPKSVRKIVVCGKRVRSSAWLEIDSIDRIVDETEQLGFGDFKRDYVEFNNTLSGIAIPSTQHGQQHFVPADPSSIMVANNKVFAFNFHEGKPSPPTDIVLNPRSQVSVRISDTKESRTDILKMDYYAITWNASTGVYDEVLQDVPTYTKYVYYDGINGYYDTDYNPLTYDKTVTVTKVGGVISLAGTGDQNKTPTVFYRYREDYSGRALGVIFGEATQDWIQTPLGTSQTVSGWAEVGTAMGTQVAGTAFSSKASYRIAYVYSDGYGRRSDVASKESSIVSFGVDKVAGSGISYELNIEKLDLPSWAKSVEVLLTRNTEHSLRISGRSSHTAYKKINTDGEEYYSGTWVADNLGMGVSIEGLVRQGHGYEFREGDRLRLYNLEEGVSDTVKTAIVDEPVIGTDGYYVLVAGDDFTGDSVINPWQDYSIEIYRPTEGDIDSLFYGNGQTHVITTGARNTFKGVLSGDLFIQYRRKYNPFDTGDGNGTLLDSASDSIFESAMTTDEDNVWVKIFGKAFLTTEFGEVLKENYARWGANIINDTKINGLGDFLALDEKITPVEHGAITAVALVGDSQSAGTVILALTATKPISLYIGATTLTNSDGTNAAIKSTDEIGLVRPQKEDYGTTNPESVFSRNGQVFYYDSINRCYCAYAGNGVAEISKNKVATFFRDVPLVTSTVITGYYNEYNMIMITVKDGYGSITDTIGYDIKENKWKGFFDIAPDLYISSNDVMYTAKGGIIYKSLKEPGSVGLRSLFHGTQFNSTINVVFNDEVDSTKTWDIIKFDIDASSLEWAGGYQGLVDTSATLTVSNENGQESVIGVADMVVEDGTVFASVLLDANSTGGYLSGDELRSKELVINFNFTGSDNIQLGIVKAVYTPS